MNKIAPDKWKHFYVGTALGIFFQVAGMHWLPGHLYKAGFITLGLVACISYGWEILSLVTGRGHYEVMDAVASVIGGITGIVMAMAGWVVFIPGFHFFK